MLGLRQYIRYPISLIKNRPNRQIFKAKLFNSSSQLLQEYNYMGKTITAIFTRTCPKHTQKQELSLQIINIVVNNGCNHKLVAARAVSSIALYFEHILHDQWKTKVAPGSSSII